MTSSTDSCKSVGTLAHVGSHINYGDLLSSREKGMYRVTCTNVEKRQELLQKPKTLKNNKQCKHIYINRDLTYLQRQKLHVRRQQSRSEDAATAPDGSQRQPGATTSVSSPATGGDAEDTQCSSTAAGVVSRNAH